VEAHLFPASASESPPPGSFAEYVLQHGVPVEIEDVLATPG